MGDHEITPAIRAQVIAELRARADELTPAGRDAFPGICGVMSSSDNPTQRPAGLYSEASTLTCTRAVFTRMLDAAEGIELYQPSNGAEGRDFMARFCERCMKDSFNPETGEGGCEIIVYTMGLDVDDAGYPREWRQDGEAGPRCTAFSAREASPC